MILPGPGLKLTDKQLGCLCVLADGEWHDRQEIREKLGLKLISSNISSRLISPLNALGIIEEEERPINNGSNKNKRVVRIKKGSDEFSFRLHFYKLMRDWCKERLNEVRIKQKNGASPNLDEKVKLYQTAYITFKSWHTHLNEERQKSEDARVSRVCIPDEASPHYVELMNAAKCIQEWFEPMLLSMCDEDDAFALRERMKILSINAAMEILPDLFEEHEKWHMNNIRMHMAEQQSDKLP